ncbi:MAG: hypothetical protein O3A10_06695 [Chloroflexi bacterium]|nr:hypothetical protein [Chloroflexota bacterium]MDA1147058.1 hypothetical protein [Chloroflexota bacterium]
MLQGSGRHRLVAMITVGLLVAVLGACSGGGGSDPLTAAQAEQIATDALLVRADLPEADWKQEESQAGLEGLIPGGGGGAGIDILPEACQSLEDAIGNLPAVLGDANPLATSSRTFSATGTLLNLKAVSTSVVVFADADGAAAAAGALGDAISADNLEGCIQAAFVPAGDNDIQIIEFTLARPSYALEGSTALSAQIDAIALILPINLTLDLHAFQRDSVLALYVAVQINTSDLTDEHAALLVAFANRVGEAQQ